MMVHIGMIIFSLFFLIASVLQSKDWKIAMYIVFWTIILVIHIFGAFGTI